MPKIIYDTGCCKADYNTWLAYHYATNQIKAKANACLQAAIKAKKDAETAANNNYPCATGNPLARDYNCGFIQSVSDTIGYALAILQIQGDYDKALAACMLGFGGALAIAWQFEKDAWNTYALCRVTTNCGGNSPVVMPDSPFPLGPVPIF